MSSLTTSEEIQKQLSIIFGFQSGQNDEIQVGDIIGVGKLTKQKVNELVFEVLRYLNAYNGMLRDYTGTEVFAIEFELKNFIEKKENLKLLPKSMVLIPGEYKDCNTLLLALTQETSLLDVHKARGSIDNLGKLFFEVEEVVERPELSLGEKKQVLKRFAERFARKAEGQIIEGKWNKKLVGIKTAQPSERDNLSSFIGIRAQYKVHWDEIKKEIKASDPQYREISLSVSEGDKYEHLKWTITGPSAYYVAQNTLQLGANLLKIANTGSINEIQQEISNIFIKELQIHLKNIGKILPIESLIPEILNGIEKIKEKFDIYELKIRNYCKSGEKGDINKILEDVSNLFNNTENELGAYISAIQELQAKIILNSNFKDRNNVRAAEVNSCIDYLKHSAKVALKIIEENYQRFFAYIYLFKIYDRFISNLFDEMQKEEKPARVLGSRFLTKFAYYVANELNEYIMTFEDTMNYNKEELESVFQKIVKKGINSYIDEVPIYINDLMGFASIMLGEQANNVKKHLENLKKVRSEFSFLLSFILRYSSFNRFLKELDPTLPITPEVLSEEFYQFIWKRIGGLKLYWKEYVLDIIKDFGAQYQEEYEKDLENKVIWSKYKICNLLTDHLKDTIRELIDPNRFIEVLDSYVAKIEDPTEQALMVLLFEQYEYSLSILDEFPSYIKQKISKILTQNTYSIAPIMASDYLESPTLKISTINNEVIPKNQNKFKIFDFREFINELELKYFSKLIPRPARIILRSIDRNAFEKTLYYNFDFRFWKKFFKFTISSNWLAIKSKY
ncbi:MAG: hypothetical protein GF364_08420 [Candidatus Lokiarchaeota archaeon]|nr:hypothetical protein [Candidatus Lokiarchaeota archaeon]